MLLPSQKINCESCAALQHSKNPIALAALRFINLKIFCVFLCCASIHSPEYTWFRMVLDAVYNIHYSSVLNNHLNKLHSKNDSSLYYCSCNTNHQGAFTELLNRTSVIVNQFWNCFRSDCNRQRLKAITNLTLSIQLILLHPQKETFKFKMNHRRTKKT